MTGEAFFPLAELTPAPKKSIKYKRPWLAEYQLDAIFCKERYGLIEASTKAGKTAGCLVWLFEQAIRGRLGHNFWWVAPVYSTAKVAFRRMKRAIPRGLYVANESELTLTLRGGQIIWFKSAEKPDSLYGEDVYAAVMDEASRCKEESWVALRTTLTATRGFVRIIGNVKGRLNWAFKLARRAEVGEPGMHFARITAYDAVKAGIIDAEEVEDARRMLSKMAFEELYLARPCPPEGRVFQSFEYAYNVRSDLVDLGGPILVGMDFNVNPMSAVLASRTADELHIWGEVLIPNANTEVMATALKEAFPGRQFIVYPDPHGSGSRKSSAPVGQTDITILQAHGFAVLVPDGQIPVVDRVNETNSMFCTADGARHCFIHPRCESLIEAAEGVLYKEGTKVVDKSLGIEHPIDALGYLIHGEFPLTGSHVSTQRLGY